MLLAWMTYALLVALFAAAAALMVERLLPHRARWAWAAAMAVGAGVPVVRVAFERWIHNDAGVTVVLGPMAPVMDAALNNLGAVASSAMAARLDLPLAGLWLAASAGLLLVVAWGWVRLQLQARAWERRSVDGTEVLLSENVGPAVVGVLSPRIVMPRWVLGLTREERRLILAHEDEHRRKKDPALLAATLLLPMLAPWNPALWFGFFRLRHAVEVDCDARVLSRGVGSPLGYAHLLFQVGTQPGSVVPLGAGFGERASSLERRIRTMLEEKRKGGGGVMVLRSLVGLTLVLMACGLEVPAESGTDSADPIAAPIPAGDVADPGAAPEGVSEETDVTPESQTPNRQELASAPTPTPFTVGPSLLNRDELIKAMEQSYPKELRDAGTSGTVRIQFFIDETGRVVETRLGQSSGHPMLDEAALGVARLYRFEPARNGEEKVPVWVSFPITFQVR